MYKEDYELIDEGMYNSYLVITGKSTFDDLLDKDSKGIAILFNPDVDVDSWDNEIIDNIIDYYTESEDYEKCQELLEVKKRQS